MGKSNFLEIMFGGGLLIQQLVAVSRVLSDFSLI